MNFVVVKPITNASKRTKHKEVKTVCKNIIQRTNFLRFFGGIEDTKRSKVVFETPVYDDIV